MFRVLVHGGLPGDGAANDVYNIQLAYFGPAFGQSLLGRPLGLAMTQPIDACSAIINADEVRGKVALVERGECRFVEKVSDLCGLACRDTDVIMEARACIALHEVSRSAQVLNAQRAGAIAVLVANNGPSGSFKMTFPESSGSLLSMIVIPIASMPRNAARPMVRHYAHTPPIRTSP